MYEKFYGLNELPFTITPNPRFFFSSAKHDEALNSMLYAIVQRKGFVVITGDIGAGKTTVCRTLINRLDARTQIALITNTHISGKDLLLSALEEFEVECTAGSKAKMLSQFNAYLIEQLRADNNVVLIVDEAQNLTPSVLEEIRMLSNLETETEKLLQIILLGQPELKKKLALARLEQLRQRIAVYYHLSPLTAGEAREYVHHRLKIAGGTDRAYFTDEAIESVFAFSKGIPRLINHICDSALLTGYVSEKTVIDAAVIREAAAESPLCMIDGAAAVSLHKKDALAQIIEHKREQQALRALQSDAAPHEGAS